MASEMWIGFCAVVVGVVTVAIVKISNKRKNRRSWASGGRDVVVVHCPRPGRHTPSISPFVLKLLTYLRLAHIHYQLDHESPMGDTGKTPWVTFNGEDISDSKVIIWRLSRHFNKDLSKGLSAVQRGVAWALTVMVEEHVCWCLRYWRFEIDGGRNLSEGLAMPLATRLLVPVFVWQQRRALWHQGIGRHTQAQVDAMMRANLGALSHYLGDQQYMMGDASEVDCTVFAFLANIIHNYARSPYYAMITEDYPNLASYVARLKNQLWPDWTTCLDHS